MATILRVYAKTVHGDLHDKNIIVEPVYDKKTGIIKDFNIKLIDFGRSRLNTNESLTGLFLHPYSTKLKCNKNGNSVCHFPYGYHEGSKLPSMLDNHYAINILFGKKRYSKTRNELVNLHNKSPLTPNNKKPRIVYQQPSPLTPNKPRIVYQQPSPLTPNKPRIVYQQPSPLTPNNKKPRIVYQQPSPLTPNNKKPRIVYQQPSPFKERERTPTPTQTIQNMRQQAMERKLFKSLVRMKNANVADPESLKRIKSSNKSREELFNNLVRMKNTNVADPESLKIIKSKNKEKEREREKEEREREIERERERERKKSREFLNRVKKTIADSEKFRKERNQLKLIKKALEIMKHKNTERGGGNF
jgi:hypothetical protein